MAQDDQSLSASARRTASFWGGALASLLVFIVALWATWWAVRKELLRTREEFYGRFRADSQQAAVRFQAKLSELSALLEAGQGFFAASNAVDQDEWQAFAQTVFGGERQEDFIAVAFIAAVKPEELSGFIRQAEQEGRAEFAPGDSKDGSQNKPWRHALFYTLSLIHI